MVATIEEARVNELGVLRVRGWAVSLSPVERVRVLFDDRLLGMAALDLPREDVGQAHPDYPNSANAGFLLQVEIPDEDLGQKFVQVSAEAAGGIRRELLAPVVVAPVIRRRGATVGTVSFHCDTISLGEDGSLYVKGWAVCPSGVQTIDVEIDDETIGQVEPSEERAGRRQPFPAYRQRPTVRFPLQRSRRRPAAVGERVIRLTVHGREGESRVILQPVLAHPVADSADGAGAIGEGSDDGIRFYLDTPAVKDGKAVETVRGFLSLGGWAFSRTGVSAIEVFVDGRSQGQAYRGIRREDLHLSFGRKEALRSGFAMLVPPQVMKRGRHDVRVEIRDASGHQEEIVFAVDAEPSLDGPGPWSLRRKITHAEVTLQRGILTAADYHPDWTLLLPLDRMPLANLKRIRATLESLRHQAYPDWRMVVPVASEAEGEAVLAGLLPDLADLSDRLRPVVAAADAPITSLMQRQGRPAMLLLLAPGDLLGEDALLEFSRRSRAARPAGLSVCRRTSHRSVGRDDARILQARLVAGPAAGDQLYRPARGPRRPSCWSGPACSLATWHGTANTIWCCG